MRVQVPLQAPQNKRVIRKMPPFQWEAFFVWWLF